MAQFFIEKSRKTIKNRLHSCTKQKEYLPLQPLSPDGGIGRRAGLKHQRIHLHPGSTPGLGTETEKVEKLSPFLFISLRNSLVC